MSTGTPRERLTTSELTDRVRAQGHTKMTERLAVQFLGDWERQGVAERHDDRWRLTPAGRAMFGHWAEPNGDGWGDLDGEELAA